MNGAEESDGLYGCQQCPRDKLEFCHTPCTSIWATQDVQRWEHVRVGDSLMLRRDQHDTDGALVSVGGFGDGRSIDGKSYALEIKLSCSEVTGTFEGRPCICRRCSQNGALCTWTSSSELCRDGVPALWPHGRWMADGLAARPTAGSLGENVQIFLQRTSSERLRVSRWTHREIAVVPEPGTGADMRGTARLAFRRAPSSSARGPALVHLAADHSRDNRGAHAELGASIKSVVD